MVVYAGKTEGRRVESRGRLAIRPESLAVQVQRGVELARSPAGENLLHRCLVDFEHPDERAQVGRRGDDGADVQIAIGPAVEAAPDAGHERIVDGGMAQRTLDAYGFERLAVFIEESGHAQHRVGLEQQQGVGRIVEIDLAGFDGGRDVLRYRLHVDFQTELERLFRAHPRSYSSELPALERLVQLDLATPEILTSKRVVTEDLQALGQQALDIVAHCGIGSGLNGGGPLLCDRTIVTDETGSGREREDCKGPL